MAAVRRKQIVSPIPQTVVKPRRRPVFRPKRKRSDPRPWRRLLLLLILFGALLFLQLSCYALEMDLSFRLEEKQKKLDASLNDTERLRMEIHRDSSLETLEKRARALGFRKPALEQYIYLK